MCVCVSTCVYVCGGGAGGGVLVSRREEAFVKEGVEMEVGEDAGYEQEKMGEEVDKRMRKN